LSEAKLITLAKQAHNLPFRAIIVNKNTRYARDGHSAIFVLSLTRKRGAELQSIIARLIQLLLDSAISIHILLAVLVVLLEGLHHGAITPQIPNLLHAGQSRIEIVEGRAVRSPLHPSQAR
jgi:hypothetical protein